MSDGVRTYYGRPVVKEPAWTWEVPWYLFFGGAAGVSAVLAAAARLVGNQRLADAARLLAAGGAAVSPPLLIADLGRPQRFHHMLRVFKPTSAMSVGSWILAAFSTAATSAGALTLLGRFPRLRALADAAAAVFGVPMATYTGALVADTSIPAWHEARRELPLLFGSSAAASAGAAAVLATPPAHAGPARRLAVGGAVVELAVDRAMRRRLRGSHGATGSPAPGGDLAASYEEGDAGRWHTAAVALTGAGAGALALGGARRPRLGAAGAALLLAGGVAQRWAVYRAGFRSAADPAQTVAPQRARLEDRARST